MSIALVCRRSDQSDELLHRFFGGVRNPFLKLENLGDSLRFSKRLDPLSRGVPSIAKKCIIVLSHRHLIPKLYNIFIQRVRCFTLFHKGIFV